MPVLYALCFPLRTETPPFALTSHSRPMYYAHGLIPRYTYRQKEGIKMEIIKVIRKFNAGYNRIGEIMVVNDICKICDKEKKCIYIDGSEGEYGGASICPECAKKECDA